jgi:hypothetical protein
LGQLIIPKIHDRALVSAYCAPLKPAKAARRAKITIVHSRRKRPPTEGALLFAFAPFALKVTDQLADPFASRAIALRHATGAGIALTGAQVPFAVWSAFWRRLHKQDGSAARLRLLSGDSETNRALFPLRFKETYCEKWLAPCR